MPIPSLPDGLRGGPLRLVLIARLQDQAHRPLTKLPRRLPPTITNDPILLKDWSVRHAGAVQLELAPSVACVRRCSSRSRSPRSPGEIFRAPRNWVQQAYLTLGYYHRSDRGGHFAAWEEPQLFAEELCAAFRPLRGQS